MKKVPILATVRAAWSFVYTHLGAIIGLVWVPVVVMTVTGFFVESRYYAAVADSLASGNVVTQGPALLGIFVYFIAVLLLYSAMYVPVVQLAQGQRKDGALLHFAFGPPEWRLFRALLGLFAFLLVPVMLSGVLASLPQLAKMQELLSVLLVLVFMGIAYAGLRFVVLLPAIAVSEEGPALPRAWKLSAGNFWRLLAILLLTVAPLLLCAGIAGVVLMGAQAMAPGLDQTPAMQAARLQAVAGNMPIAKGIEFFIAPLLTGLVASISASVYAVVKDTGRVNISV